MLEPSSSTSTACTPPAGLAALHAWRRDAALRLGADDAVARQFGLTGQLALDDKPLSLQPLSEKPTGPWLATARAGRPTGVDEERWCDALLQASSQSLLVAHAAFGLADEGDAVLVLRIPEGLDDPALLAVEVAGLLALRCAVIEGALALPQQAVDSATIGSRIHGQGPADLSHGSAGIAHLDAPEDVLVMIHAAMLHLGRTAAQALATTRTGKVEIDGRRIGLAFDIEGAGLVIAAELGPGVLDSPPQRRAAAMANTDLMAFIGMAVVRERSHARLMTRWCLPGQSAESFAGRLCDVARLANAIVQRHTAHASH
jgi:hypothetical protein